MGAQNCPSFEEFRASLYRTGLSQAGPENKRKIGRLLDEEWMKIRQDIAAISDEVRRKYQEVFLRFGKEEYSDYFVAEAQKERIAKGKILVEQVKEGNYAALRELENLMFGKDLPLIGQQKISLEDLEVERGVFLSWRKACYVQEGKKIVEKIKAGDMSEVSQLSSLISLANAPLDKADEKLKYEDFKVEGFHITEAKVKKWQQDSLVETQKNIIKAAQQGNYKKFSDVSFSLRSKWSTYEELEISKEQFQELEHKQDVLSAQKYLEEAKAGNYARLRFLETFLRTFQDRPIPRVDYAEIGFEKEAFEKWAQEQYRAMGQKWATECKQGDYSHVHEFELAVSSHRINLEDLNVEKNEFLQWVKMPDRTNAQEMVEEIEKGDYGNFFILEDLLTGKKITLRDIRRTKADFQKWKRENDLIRGKIYQKEMKSGNVRAVDSLKLLLERGNITLKDLGIKKSDFNRWLKRV